MMLPSTKIALTNVRVFDGERLREPGTVIIDGTCLGDDATDAVEEDCKGAILLPGLIDAHIVWPAVSSRNNTLKSCIND